METNMKGKVTVLIPCAMLLALSLPAEAQQAGKVPRIGYVSATGDPSNPGPNVEGFRQGLRDLGYVEGKNILVEYRYVEGKGDRNPSLVAELVQLKVDVLVVGGPGGIHAAKQATKAIPIVIVTQEDPVAAGYIDSLARPGGNITGLTRLTRELSGKRLELLTEVVPKISRVGVFWEPPNRPGILVSGFKYYEVAAPALKMQLQSLEVRGSNDFEGAFRVAANGRANALIMIRSPVLTSSPKADCGACHKEPTAFNERDK